MRHRLTVVVPLVLVISGGCASYEATLAPIPKAETMPARIVEGPVSVSADPFVEEERQTAVFHGDMDDKGVLPIQVVVQNQGERPLLIRGSDMLLVLENGTQISSSGVTAVADKFQDADNRGQIPASLAFGIIGAVVSQSATGEAKANRRADYKSKRFPDVTLGKNESAHGFSYFILPVGTPAFTKATLRVYCVDVESAKGLVVNLPVSGLGFK